MSKETAPQIGTRLKRQSLQKEYGKHLSRWKLLEERKKMLSSLLTEIESDIIIEADKVTLAAKKLEL